MTIEQHFAAVLLFGEWPWENDMATVRFGKTCDRCEVIHDNYDVADIADCEDCGLDLCDKCGEETGHVVISDWDLDTYRLRSCYHDFKPWWTGKNCMVCGKPHSETVEAEA
jgi:hypothetical protein